jgi:hypothetical protein
MSSESGKTEVTPETLLERLRDSYASIRDMLKVFSDFHPYMKNAILAANADANTKADALFYYGVLVGLLDILLVIDIVARDLSLVIERRDVDNQILDMRRKLRDEIIEVATKLVQAYTDLKKGSSLEDIKGRFNFLVWKILEDIKEYTKNIDKYFDYLLPP